MENTSYHSCRWCKWYASGKCTNSAITASEDDIHPFFEDGTLAEAIREGFSEPQLPAFEREISQARLSAKAKHELLHTLYEELEAQKVNWVERIDESVSTALLAREVDSGVEIEDPYSFYCNAFV